MESLKTNRWMPLLAICMFLISIFMAISYHGKIEAGDGDSLTGVAYYIWIFFIPVWLMIAIFNYRLPKKR